MANLNERSYPKGLREIRYPSDDIIHRYTSQKYTGEIRLDNETGEFIFNPPLTDAAIDQSTLDTFVTKVDLSGGTTGQLLTKVDDTDNNYDWQDAPATGIEEAPEDGTPYSRQDAGWVSVPNADLGQYEFSDAFLLFQGAGAPLNHVVLHSTDGTLTIGSTMDQISLNATNIDLGTLTIAEIDAAGTNSAVTKEWVQKEANPIDVQGRNVISDSQLILNQYSDPNFDGSFLVIGNDGVVGLTTITLPDTIVEDTSATDVALSVAGTWYDLGVAITPVADVDEGHVDVIALCQNTWAGGTVTFSFRGATDGTPDTEIFTIDVEPSSSAIFRYSDSLYSPILAGQTVTVQASASVSTVANIKGTTTPTEIRVTSFGSGGGTTQDLQSVIDTGATAITSSDVTFYMNGGTNTFNVATNGGAGIVVSDNTDSVNVTGTNITLDVTSGGTIEIDNSTGITITDPRSLGNHTGAQYAADYSADFTNRSLVDKEYVDSVAGGITDAPSNGNTYARKNGAWTAIATSKASANQTYTKTTAITTSTVNTWISGLDRDLDGFSIILTIDAGAHTGFIPSINFTGFKNGHIVIRGVTTPTLTATSSTNPFFYFANLENVSVEIDDLSMSSNSCNRYISGNGVSRISCKDCTFTNTGSISTLRPPVYFGDPLLSNTYPYFSVLDHTVSFETCTFDNVPSTVGIDFTNDSGTYTTNVYYRNCSTGTAPTYRIYNYGSTHTKYAHFYTSGTAPTAAISNAGVYASDTTISL